MKVQVGTRPLKFNVGNVTASQAQDLIDQRGRVFRLELRAWNVETGVATIALLPDIGQEDAK